MDNQWFDNPKFRELCIENHIEPVITGDDQLILVCPKLPDEHMVSAFAELIPQELEWGFSEGLSTGSVAAVKIILGMFYVPLVVFKFETGGRVVLLIPPLNKNVRGHIPSSLWDQVVAILLRDPFTRSYEIRVGCCQENPMGEVYRNSEGDPVKGVSEESDNGPVHQESPLLTAAKKVKTPKISDDRFNYDKEFLPKDVASDVKILLESCKNVEEFLRNI